MKLSKFERENLLKLASVERKEPTLMSQIERHPGRAVAVSTVLERLRKWPNISLHDACTMSNMNVRG